MFELRPVPKPLFQRVKPTQKQITAITDRVRKEVQRRSGGACERCGRTQAWTFEMAHLINRSQRGSGREPWNIALLCGPSVNTGTCHHFADYTEDGRRWKMEFQEKLKQQYKESEWL